jgi:ribosomal protein S18 acetylase RimI-like enzyme
MKIDIRKAVESDWPNIRIALLEEQEYERALHDTRLPGDVVADPYLARFRDIIDHHYGAVFVAEADGIFTGYAGCSVVEDDNPAETADSNRFGLIHDICVLEVFRGRGIAGHLLAAAEAHLAAQTVSRIRICALAANASAIRAYRKQGFQDYEVTFEKRIKA